MHYFAYDVCARILSDGLPESTTLDSAQDGAGPADGAAAQAGCVSLLPAHGLSPDQAPLRRRPASGVLRRDAAATLLLQCSVSEDVGSPA